MFHRTNTPSTDAHAESAWIQKLDTPVRDAGSHASHSGPLFGLTFAIKDNINAAGVPTTAACPEFAHTPTEHATVVHRLLQSGAKLKGKTNLDQFACGLNGTRSPYGAVPNAFNPEYVSGGSSSGSAYVVATGQVDFALGTDTAGSGRVPAGLNNIVGFKPTKGRLSTTGVLPAARSVDTVSIFARSVPLAWEVLMVAAGHDQQDPYSRSEHDLPWRAQPFPRSPRIGVPDALEFFGDAESRAAFDRSLQRLRDMGAQLVPIDYSPLSQAADLLYGSALVAERHSAIRDFFDSNEAAVIEPVRTIIKQAHQYSATDVYDAQLKLKALDQFVRPMWQKIDLMVVPTTPTHVRIQDMMDDPIELNRRLGYYTNFVNLLDYAALSVPSDFRKDGLPFGITFIGPAGSDWPLAEWGTRYHAQVNQDSPKSWGATERPLTPFDLTPPHPPGPELSLQPECQLAVVGAHLSGMPLNGQLTERGARLIERARTAACYKLFALADTKPAKPGLIRVDATDGVSVDVEIWSLPLSKYGSFVAGIPAPLGIGTLELEDGRKVQGFLCEPHALERATDISPYGGWRAYVESQQTQVSHSPA
jgi:allophanate hydrolase